MHEACSASAVCGSVNPNNPLKTTPYYIDTTADPRFCYQIPFRLYYSLYYPDIIRTYLQYNIIGKASERTCLCTQQRKCVNYTLYSLTNLIMPWTAPDLLCMRWANPGSLILPGSWVSESWESLTILADVACCLTSCCAPLWYKVVMPHAASNCSTSTITTKAGLAIYSKNLHHS